MRTTLILFAVTFAALFVPAQSAWAHGGTFRGPRVVRPAWLRCDCARVDCPHCCRGDLAGLEGVTTRRLLNRTLEQWDDLVQVETRVRFETTRTRGVVEGHAVVRHAPLFAATAGGIEVGESALTGRLAASVAARRDYLWERLGDRDPLLVLRLDAGAVKLRAFPITSKGPTFAIVRGYALSDDIGRKGIRVYRTGARFLVIVPLRDLPKGAKPDFVDPGGDRGLFFLDEKQARKRLGKAARAAREVPCVAALECALRDHGKDAVTKHAALVAVPKNGGAPKDLVVSENAPSPLPPGPPPRRGAAPEPTPPPAPPASPPIANGPPLAPPSVPPLASAGSGS